MNKNKYLTLAAISIFLYSALGVFKETMEKYFKTLMTVGAASYSDADYILSVSPYTSILLIAASVFAVLALISFICERQRNKPKVK